MSKFNFPAKMIFGRDGTQTLRSVTDAAGQKQGETVAASTGRRFVGPVKNGCGSAHLIVGAGITGSITVWYSNLPDPDETADGDWVQETNAAATVALTGAATNVYLYWTSVLASWFRIKVIVSGGSGTVACWVRNEGDQSR